MSDDAIKEILVKPLSELKVSKTIIDKIERRTRCTQIRDLLILTPKELCLEVGLNKQELLALIAEMEDISENTNSRRFMRQIERCKQCLEVYKQYIPEGEVEEYNANDELTPDFCCEHEDITDTKYKEISIEEMNLSVRSFNCLKRGGIHTVYDLMSKSIDELKSIRNMGKKSLIEIFTSLEKIVDVLPAEFILIYSLEFDNEFKELLEGEIETLEDLISMDSFEILRMVGYKREVFEEIVKIVNKKGYYFRDYSEGESVDEYINKKSAVAITRLFNEPAIIKKLDELGVGDVVKLQELCINDLENADFTKSQIELLIDELLINGIALKGDKVKKCDFCNKEYVYVPNFVEDEKNYCPECCDKVKRLQNIKNLDIELEKPDYGSFGGGENGFYITATVKNITKKLCRVKLNDFYLVSDERKWVPRYFLTGYQFDDEDIIPNTVKSIAKIWCGSPWTSRTVEENDYVIIELIIKDSVKQIYKFVYTKTGWRKDDFFSVKIK